MGGIANASVCAQICVTRGRAALHHHSPPCLTRLAAVRLSVIADRRL